MHTIQILQRMYTVSTAGKYFFIVDFSKINDKVIRGYFWLKLTVVVAKETAFLFGNFFTIISFLRRTETQLLNVF